MNSVLLQIATKYIKWILVTVALIALFRGHNHPGGGFIGGLLVGLSVVLQSLAGNARKKQNKLKIQPEGYIALGLFFILISTLPGLFMKDFFMAGIWISLPIPFWGELKLGTPFIFDIGVFLAVTGVTLLLFFTLNNFAKWK